MNKWKSLPNMVLFQLFSIMLVFNPALEAQSSLPASVDLSMTKYFPPVANQGKIGSCDWFAAVYYQMTYTYNKALDRAASPGNTFSPKFGYNILNNAGIFPYNIRLDDVYKFVQKHGCATMEDLPYDMAEGTGYRSWCTVDSVWEKALYYRIMGYKYFTMNHSVGGAYLSFNDPGSFLDEIKKLLSEGEILVIQSNPFTGNCRFTKVSDDVNTPADDNFAGDYIISKGDNNPDHTMAVVGFNDHIWVDLNQDGIVQEKEKGAIKIADSFGRHGVPNRNEGFLWMAYATVSNSIFQNRVNRIMIRPHYKPEIICRLTLNSAHRDKIKFQFGRGKLSRTGAFTFNPSHVFDPYGTGYEPGTAGVSLIEGGNCAYNGESDPSDGNFVFDLTDIKDGNNTAPWYLRIENSGSDPLIIKNLEIINLSTGQILSDNSLPVRVVKKEIIRSIAPD